MATAGAAMDRAKTAARPAPFCGAVAHLWRFSGVPASAWLLDDPAWPCSGGARRGAGLAVAAGATRLTGQVRDRVHVAQPVDQRHALAAEAAHRIIERVFARPAHSVEQRCGHALRAAQPDQPIAAVMRRTEHRVMPSEGIKGTRDMGGAN